MSVGRRARHPRATLHLVLALSLPACADRPPGLAGSASQSPFATADSLRDDGRFLQAHPLYRSLRDSFALAGDSANLWRAQVWWAYTLTRTNRTDSAQTALETAMQLVGGDPHREGWTRWVRCTRFSRIGQSDSAIVECGRALAIAETTGNDELEASAHFQLGTIHSRLGHYRTSVAETERTLAIQRRHGHPPLQVMGTFNSMGIEYAAVGRLGEAEQMYGKGLHLADSLGSVWDVALLKSNLAYLRFSTGDLPDALRLMTESLRDAAQLPDTQSMVYAHNSLAEFYLKAGNRTAARYHLERSVAMNQRVAALFRVIALVALGMLETADSNVAVAEKTLSQALALADTAGFGLQRVRSRAAMSRLAIIQGKPSLAVRLADAAVLIADSLEAPDARIEALEARAAALEAARRSDASDGYLKGIELLESWRGRLALGDLRMGVAEPRWRVYEGAIRTLLAKGRHAEALRVAERARARLLLEVMAERDASQPATSPLEAVRQRLRVRYEERAAASRPEDQGSLDRDLAALTDSFAALEAVESARYPAPASVDRLRAELLGAQRALLTFFWGDSAVYGWWVTQDSVRSARLGSADSLSALVDFLRGTIESPASDSGWATPARRAFERFIAPLRPAPVDEVLVVADGPLAHVPIEVLIPAPGAAPWGATTRFIYGPSASVLLALTRSRSPVPWKHTMLAVGNPSVGRGRVRDSLRAANDLEPGPLPYAEGEARAISELFRGEGADLLLGRRATIDQWMRLGPSNYRYLHFATHARINDRRPDRTHLVLSQGVLTLPEIRALRLRAELVTLSACETALGRRVRGEGVIGLPHAFLAAGARGVLVTLWRIGDQSASDFMRDFYRELHAGQSPAEALRIVRHEWMTGDGPSAHPSRWAPFVLVGGISEGGG